MMLKRMSSRRSQCGLVLLSFLAVTLMPLGNSGVAGQETSTSALATASKTTPSPTSPPSTLATSPPTRPSPTDEQKTVRSTTVKNENATKPASTKNGTKTSPAASTAKTSPAAPPQKTPTPAAVITSTTPDASASNQTQSQGHKLSEDAEVAIIVVVIIGGSIIIAVFIGVLSKKLNPNRLKRAKRSAADLRPDYSLDGSGFSARDVDEMSAYSSRSRATKSSHSVTFYDD